MLIQMLLVLLTTETMQGQLLVHKISNELQLFGVWGKSVLLHLPMPPNTSEVQLQKDRQRLLKVKKSENATTAGNLNRVHFNINGTVRISSSSDTDSGVYKWEAFDSQGKLLLNITFTLKIEEQLPKPHLHVLCQSFGERRVQCVPGGQEYRWTLNSTPINSSVAFMNNPGDVIVLKGNLTGNLTCIIYNNASSKFTTAELPVCKQGDYLKQVCFNGEEKPGRAATDITNSIPTKAESDQICVNSKMFLLACGALGMLVTFTAALCCLRMALDIESKSFHSKQVIYSEINFGNKRARKECSEMEDSAVAYGEVRRDRGDDQQHEGQADLQHNQTFTTYGINETQNFTV